MRQTLITLIALAALDAHTSIRVVISRFEAL
jgi:hypothetical protein